MRSWLRGRLTYANVAATVALVLAAGALGGPAVADSVSAAAADVERSVKRALGLAKKADRRSKRALALARRRSAGPQGPAGPRGEQGTKGDTGPKGEAGPKGETGTVDTSNFYDKAASDARFLGIGATATDAQLLDGIDSTGFLRPDGPYFRLPTGDGIPDPGDCTGAGHHGRALLEADRSVYVCTDDGWGRLAVARSDVTLAPSFPEVDLTGQLTGFPPNAPVSYSYIPTSGAAPLGTTNASGNLTVNVPVLPCNPPPAAGTGIDFQFFVDGAPFARKRLVKPSC